MKSSQNSEAEKRDGTITDPPEKRDARKPASSPWTWKRGMTNKVRSFDVSLYVVWTFSVLFSFIRDPYSKSELITHSLSSLGSDESMAP